MREELKGFARAAVLWCSFVAGATADAYSAEIYVGVVIENARELYSETIAVPWDSLVAELPEARPDNVRVMGVEEIGAETIASQFVDEDGDGEPDQLVFQVDFLVPTPRPGDVISKISPHPAVVRPGTPTPGLRSHSVRIVTTDERIRQPIFKVHGLRAPANLREFAWENDRVAFRMFESIDEPIEDDLVGYSGSGVSVWGKPPPALLLNRWYQASEVLRSRYLGEGRGFYIPRSTRGCGGTGVWHDGKLYVSPGYQSVRVLANGPVRFVAELIYAPWAVGDFKVSEIKRVTLDAGTNFALTESTFLVHGAPSSTELIVAVGLWDQADREIWSHSGGSDAWLARWDDFGEHGELGTAVIMERDRFFGYRSDETDNLIVARIISGETVRFLNGFGWTKSGEKLDAAAWEARVVEAARRWRTSMRLSIGSSGWIPVR